MADFLSSIDKHSILTRPNHSDSELLKHCQDKIPNIAKNRVSVSITLVFSPFELGCFSNVIKQANQATRNCKLQVMKLESFIYVLFFICSLIPDICAHCTHMLPNNHLSYSITSDVETKEINVDKYYEINK